MPERVSLKFCWSRTRLHRRVMRDRTTTEPPGLIQRSLRDRVDSPGNCSHSPGSGSRDRIPSSSSSTWYAKSEGVHTRCHCNHWFLEHSLLWGRSLPPTDTVYNTWPEFDYCRCGTQCCYFELDCWIVVAGATGSSPGTPLPRHYRFVPACLGSCWHHKRAHSRHFSVNRQ